MRGARSHKQAARGARREFLRALGFGALALVTPTGLPAVTLAAGVPDTRKPNFLVVLVDDLGWTDLGCQDSSLYETPHIDRLASQGVRFTDAYAACPVCSPTRAAILTGKHPARLGITDWIPGQRPRGRKWVGPPIPDHLPLQEVTIAEALKSAGYATFFAGKWHLGDEGFLPQQQGFDVNVGGNRTGTPRGGYYVPYKNPQLADGPEGEYLTDRLTDEVLRFMDAHPERPFLAYLSFYNVHSPIQPCQRHIERFRRKAAGLPPVEEPAYAAERNAWTKQRQDNPAYASMVHAVDENVGRLLRRLDELGLSDNTVVIFASDNGGLTTLPRKGSPTAVLPLRAGKGWCYEGGIRVPLIIRAPGVSRPGSVSRVPVISMDYYPTILELASLPSRPKQHRDGLSLVPLLKGAADLKRDAIYWHYPHHHGSNWTPGAAVRVGEWKLITFYEEERIELYNLANDLQERHDLAERMPQKRDELLEKLRAWQRRVGAKMPQPNPDYKKPSQ